MTFNLVVSIVFDKYIMFFYKGFMKSLFDFLHVEESIEHHDDKYVSFASSYS